MGKLLTTERAATVTDLGRVRSSVALAGRDGERLIEWLREAFLLHTDTRPVVIYLRHVTPGRKLGDKLGTIQLKALDPDQRSAEAAPEMAHALWAKAENYAAGLGGSSQQFGAHAYYEDDPAESETATFFWIKVSQAADAIDSLPANEGGVLRLVMGKLDRFEDNFCDLMTGSVTMMQCMREQIRDMHEQALLDRKERRENEEVVRKSKIAEIDREAQREASKADREMKKELGETVKTVGLAIARKWGGLDVRDVTSPGSKQLMTVFESLSQDEGRFMDLLSRLSPVERTNFMEWWQGQIAALEQVKAGGVTSAAATAAPAPAAPKAPEAPAAASTPAEQAAVAETQAQQWAAVAAALKADAAAQAAAPAVEPTPEPTPEPPAPKPSKRGKKE